MKTAVIISFYDRRPIEPLVKLLDSLDKHAPGGPYERFLSVNSTGAQELPRSVVKRVAEVLMRPNIGMNIGAWDAGWRHWSGFDSYLFLQDECYAIREQWLQHYQQALADPSTGLVGESLNEAWDRPWRELRETVGQAQMPEHFLDGRAANRVDVYLHFLRRAEIDPGATGRHLRSLVWASRADVLTCIGGFPLGANYGECIAAEIGVSRAVESCGLRLRTVGPGPFWVFRHLEWNQDVAGGRFTHKPQVLRELSMLRERVRLLEQTQANPYWTDIFRLIGRKLWNSRQAR